MGNQSMPQSLAGGLLNDTHLNNLDINHVKNLTTDLEGKLDTSGGIVQGDIDLADSFNLLNLNLVNTINLGSIIDTAVTFSSAGLQSSLVGNGNANSYYSGNGTVQDFSSDNVTAVSPNFFMTSDNLLDEITVSDVSAFAPTNQK